jgi:hypothetical protein
MSTELKSLTQWAEDLKVEKSQLSRWLSGTTKKVPAHIEPVLPIIKANLKAHKSTKFATNILQQTDSIVDLASESIKIRDSESVRRGSNPLSPANILKLKITP